MRTVIRKWGNSLAVRIPKSFAKETRLNNETLIELQIKPNSIVIRRAVRKSHSLKALLARMRPEHRHPETDWGKPVGREEW
jgi:antitoxin MazE